MSTALLIPMRDIESSHLKAIGYDAETFTLSARFMPGKQSPMGKVYHYSGVSEETWDDIENPKSGRSIGQAFAEIIKKNPDKYPFLCVEVNPPEVVTDFTANGTPVPATVVEAKMVIIPDDEEGLKTLAIATRAEVTALTITTAGECESASLEVLRVREQRKLAIEKVNRIKIPATQAWQAACALFNEIDGRYAEAEKYLDGGILAYRATEKRRAAEEAAELKRQEDDRLAAAIREQQAQFRRDQEAAEIEAKQKADELAKSDATIAQAQGAPAEVVRQILENPIPVTVRHVAPPPLAFTPAPPPIAKYNMPQVAGLGFTTVWCYEITDESAIPVDHNFYSLDTSKLNGRVQDLKQHANIPGVRVWSEERSIKRTSKKG